MTTTELIRTHADAIPRGRGGKPKVKNPVTGALELYYRPSTVAGVLDDKSNLMAWYGRQALLGVLAQPSLLDGLREDPGTIKDVQKAAHLAAGSEKAAEAGTEIHTLTEGLDSGTLTLDDVPVKWKALLSAYVDLTAKFEVLDQELFVVQDDIKAAGSLDKLYRLPDGSVVVGDVKTGNYAADYSAGSAAIQTAIYAESQRYCPATGQRQPLHPDLDITRTLLIHLPQDPTKMPALYWLNAIAGWDAAQVAIGALKWRSVKPIIPF